MPEFTAPIAAMIGIGVGIDYALLIVTRYRQGLHDGLEPREAVVLALDTSGRAVVFAGITVVISLLGMFLMNLDFMRSVAVAAISAVLMTMLAAITLLPALPRLRRPQHRPLRPAPPRARPRATARSSFWYRWSRLIQAHPWPALIISIVILVVLALPVFDLRLGFADAGNRGEDDTTRRAYDLLSEGFGPGFNGPMLIVVDTPGGEADMPKVQQVADGDPEHGGRRLGRRRRMLIADGQSGASSTSSRPRRRRTRRRPTWCTGCATRRSRRPKRAPG